VRQSSSTRATHDVQTDGRSQQETVSTRARASGDDDVTMTSRREERDGDVRACVRAELGSSRATWGADVIAACRDVIDTRGALGGGGTD